MDHIGRSGPDFSDPFLRNRQATEAPSGAAGSVANSADSEEGGGGSSSGGPRGGVVTELAIAAPKAFEKHEKMLPHCVSLVDAAKSLLEESLELAISDPSSEQLQTSYEKTCFFRLVILDIWSSNNTVAEIEETIALCKDSKFSLHNPLSKVKQEKPASRFSFLSMVIQKESVESAVAKAATEKAEKERKMKEEEEEKTLKRSAVSQGHQNEGKGEEDEREEGL